MVLGSTGQRGGWAFVYRALTVSGGRFHGLRLAPHLVTLRAAPYRCPTTPPEVAPERFGLLPVRSPLLGESRLLSLPRGTEMFQFPRFASPTYQFSRRYAGITPRGFPHSGIRGSQPACGSPRLFAACHALPRFLAPRHPPSALTSLTTASSVILADSSSEDALASRGSRMRLSKSWRGRYARAEIMLLARAGQDRPSRSGRRRRPPDLLRKEVIQPQVPLRLPCYDFTPITDHTFGACPPCGLAQRLLVPPAFVV